MTAPTGGTLEVDGLRKFTRLLSSFGDDLVDEWKSENLSLARRVADTARPPVRSGDLASDIRAGATKRSGTVKVGRARVPYANPIHWGWPRMRIRPQPFLVDALDARRDEIEAAYVAAVEKILGRMAEIRGAD